jgi:hypothetical protein
MEKKYISGISYLRKIFGSKELLIFGLLKLNLISKLPFGK